MLEFAEQPQPDEETIKPRETVEVSTPQDIIDKWEYVKKGLEITQNFDEITYKHMLAVADLIYKISDRINLPAEEINMLIESALVHDIGKTNIDQDILFKEGGLSEEDWKKIKKHTKESFDYIIKNNRSDIAKIAVAHHDHDGSNSASRANRERRYERIIPERRETDQQIIKLSRILAIADNFESLRSKRHYKDSLPLEEVKKILLEKFPTAEDLKIIEALMELHD